MPPKPVAVVFVHGLARKPAPESSATCGSRGSRAATRVPTCSRPPTRGSRCRRRACPPRSTTTRTSSTARTTKRTSRPTTRRTRKRTRSPPSGWTRSRATCTPAARDAARARLRAQAGGEAQANLDALPAEAMAAPGGPPAPGQLEIASWLPGPVKQAIIKKAAMEAYYFLFDKEYERADGQRFKVRSELRRRLLTELAARGREGREGRGRRPQHGHDGRLRRAAQLSRVPARRHAGHARLAARHPRSPGRADRGGRSPTSTSPPPSSRAGSTSTTRSTRSAARTRPRERLPAGRRPVRRGREGVQLGQLAPHDHALLRGHVVPAAPARRAALGLTRWTRRRSSGSRKAPRGHAAGRAAWDLAAAVQSLADGVGRLDLSPTRRALKALNAARQYEQTRLLASAWIARRGFDPTVASTWPRRS